MSVSAFMPDCAFGTETKTMCSKLRRDRLALCVHIPWTISDDWSLQFLVDNGSQSRMFRMVYNTKSTFSECFYFCQLVVLYRLANNKIIPYFVPLLDARWTIRARSGKVWVGMSYRHFHGRVKIIPSLPSRELSYRYACTKFGKLIFRKILKVCEQWKR